MLAERYISIGMRVDKAWRRTQNGSADPTAFFDTAWCWRQEVMARYKIITLCGHAPQYNHLNVIKGSGMERFPTHLERSHCDDGLPKVGYHGPHVTSNHLHLNKNYAPPMRGR